MSATEPRELAGLTVSVDRVIYHPRADLPPERPHCYVYFITITNQSDVTVTLRARKWVVRNGKGQVSVLEGDGIVGQKPTLAPGETFEYNSFHLLETRDGEAEGCYLGVDSEGKLVLAKIPRFKMTVPPVD